MRLTKRARPPHHSGMKTRLRLVADNILLGKSPEERVERMELGFPKLQTESSADQNVNQKQLQAYQGDNKVVEKYVTTRQFLKGEYSWKQQHQAGHCYPLKDFDEDVLAARMAIPKEICCQLFCDLVHGWDVDDTGKGQLSLGDRLLKGGFVNAYSSVNAVPHPQFEEEQSHVIFAAGNLHSKTMQTHNPNFKEFIGAVNLELSKQGFSLDWDSATDPGLEPIHLVETHFLFGFSKLTHFLYHKDKIYKSGLYKGSYLSVIINLTPCQSSFDIAGAKKPFEFDVMGSAAVFPSCFWHRSGKAQTGTVKVALFYLKRERAVASSSVLVDIDATASGSDEEFCSDSDSDAPAPSEVPTSAAKKVKKETGEVKQRVAPRGKHP